MPGSIPANTNSTLRSSRREQLQVENTPEGHEVLVRWLRGLRVKRVGIEASGGYEQPVVAELRRKRFVVVVFQPAQVRAYAKFHLQRAKNDKIDAALINVLSFARLCIVSLFLFTRNPTDAVKKFAKPSRNPSRRWAAIEAVGSAPRISLAYFV